MPEELTEEEKKAEADKAEQQRKEDEAKKVFTFVKPVSGERFTVQLYCRNLSHIGIIISII